MKARHQLTGVLTTLVVLTLAVLGIAATAAVTAGAISLRIDQTLVGTVDLQWGVPGVYSDALTEPSPAVLAALPDLGDIDLGLWLEDGPGNAVSGYVDLTTTLVFTKVNTVNTTLPGDTAVTAQDVGPRVTGTFNGTNLTLESERFAFTTATGATGERQFRLIGTVSNGVATGEYRETAWGFSVDPSTVVGDFTLVMVTSPPDVPTSVGASRFFVASGPLGVIIVVAVALLVLATVGLRRRRYANRDDAGATL